MKLVAELAAKALGGGALVVAFAMLAQPFSPKRFAGIFAGAPSVAAASLTVTCLFSGPHDASRACVGMVEGAAGFVVYCLLAPGAVRRFGALKGAALTITAWALTAAVVLPVLARLAVLGAASKGAAVAAGRRGLGRRRASIRVDLQKLREATLKDVSLRFAFGAGTAAAAGVLSKAAGPLVGGVMLAFPAILLASLTLIADEDGQAAARDDARGARAGAIGLIAFAVLGSRLFGRLPSPAALTIAAAGWAVAAATAYGVAWFLGYGDDEPRESDG